MLVSAFGVCVPCGRLDLSNNNQNKPTGKHSDSDRIRP